MQGWRISMEDAHANILDLKAPKASEALSDAEHRISFFGVYDGHGGDKVALYSGEHLHEIIAKQEAFKRGDLEKAIKDGFLATDRAILSGSLFQNVSIIAKYPRSTLRGRSFWMHGVHWSYHEQEDLCGQYCHEAAI
jgi:serine/threonine protein phosphatase PrpC